MSAYKPGSLRELKRKADMAPYIPLKYRNIRSKPIMTNIKSPKDNLIMTDSEANTIFGEWSDDGPIISPEIESEIHKFYNDNPAFKQTEIKAPNKTWIQTFTGKKFYPLEPKVEDVCIEDIAHALSMQCRFSGHTKWHYSVTQHSVGVSYLCAPGEELWGLLHDASEAFLVDIPRPLKRSGKFDPYLEFESTVQKVICQKFNLPEEEPKSVKSADLLMLATEARDLMGPLHPEWIQQVSPLPLKIDKLSPSEAEKLFLNRFNELYKSK